jgi:hypothetical protein
MRHSTKHTRRKRLLAVGSGAILALAALAGSAGATEYHHFAWDIQTNQGRACGHGLNGTPREAVGLYQRDIESETSVICYTNPAGQSAHMWANLYLDYDYGTQVDAAGWQLGVGGEFYVGSSSVWGDSTNVLGRSRVYNVPTRFAAVPWTTYELPTASTEDFSSWPSSKEYHCQAYWRLHDGLNGWHLSGLTCFGEGVFTTGVAPYYN